MNQTAITEYNPDEQQNTFLAMVERLAINPEVDVSKIQQILNMQEQILDRNAKQAFNAAMVRAQAKIKAIPRDARNDQTNSKYSRHETIVKLAAPIYTAEGFSLSFYEGDSPKENHIRVMCDIMHELGHTVTRHVDVALDDSGIKGSVNKTKVHAEGSSFSYGRRYLTCMIFNIPTGDDNDGQGQTEYITDAQVSEIRDLIDNTGADEKKFLIYLKVESVEKIPAKKFNTAKIALQQADIARKKNAEKEIQK